MKENNSLDYLLEMYKIKIEKDGYIIQDYICSCGETHTIILLYSNKNIAEFINNDDIIIIDKNHRYLNCHKCGSTTDLLNLYLAIINDGYIIKNIDEINLMN